MMDLFCLDYEQRLYALVICDLGSGAAWAFPIVYRQPPDSESVYVATCCSH